MPTKSGRQSMNRTWSSGNTRMPSNERRRRRSEANGRPRGRPSAPQPLLVSTLGRRKPNWVNISPRFSVVLQESSELGGRKSARLVVQPSSPQTSPRYVFFFVRPPLYAMTRTLTFLTGNNQSGLVTVRLLFDDSSCSTRARTASTDNYDFRTSTFPVYFLQLKMGFIHS